jgi:hydroxymethylglutaryl-CoA synthase
VKVGIDSLAIYTPRYALDLATLGSARGIDPNKYYVGLGQQRMAVPPPGEDIVTMAANASFRALSGIDLNQIEMLLFATESAVDLSKAAGIYVHDLLHLPSRCRTLELKQACYSGTAAIQLVLPYLRENPDKKILLIASDIARYGLNTTGESSQGAGAVAMVLSAHPRIIAFEKEYGLVTENVMDFWRPIYLQEALVEGKYSSKLYLSMLEKTWAQYQTLSKRHFSDHAYFCYHTPVPRLVEKAHQHLLKLNQQEDLSAATLEAQIGPGLLYGRETGNSYAASLYVSLASLLDHVKEDLAEKRIGFYSYGSGCVAEYFSGIVQEGHTKTLQTDFHARLFSERALLSYNEYESFFNFEYVKDGSEQEIPIYDTGQFRIARLKHHKRIYERVEEKITTDDLSLLEGQS